MKKYLYISILLIAVLLINCKKENETQGLVLNGDYEPETELKEEAIFNIDLLSKRYQPTHIEICQSNAFVIFGKFIGKKPLMGKYKLNKIEFVTRNLFPLDTLNYEIESITDSIISDNKINLKINITESDNPIQKKSKTFTFPNDNNKIKKSCLLDISIFLDGKKYNPCSSGIDRAPRMQNIGGHACEMYLVY